MKIKNIHTYPLSLIASLVVIYLVANDQHGWYIYLLLGFIILERALLQFVLKMISDVQKKLAHSVASEVQRILTQARASGLSNPYDRGVDE